MSEFEGQVAIITGGARGIGAEIARRLARGGATVVCVDVLETAEIVDEIGKAGGTAEGRHLDVTDADSIADILEGAEGCYVLVDPFETEAARDAIPAIKDAGHRMPLIRCPISDYYCRQEKNGLLLGFYEQGCKTWGMDGIDPHFVNALCPDDLDRVMDVLEGAFARMPALREARAQSSRLTPFT